MKAIPHKAAALMAVLSITLAGCSAAEVKSIASQAQSQGGAVISNLTEQAKELGEKSLQVAQNIKQSVAGYIGNVTGSTAPVTADDFEATWNDVQMKLNEMADNAVSPAARARVEALSQDLQNQFREASDKISKNENVQEVKETVSRFWNEVKIKMDDLAP